MIYMDAGIGSLLSDFRNTIIYENRYFISDHPFLDEFRRIIEQDLHSSEPQITATIPKGYLLFRARSMDEKLGNARTMISEMMRQYGGELSGIESCKSCKDNNKCNYDRPSLNSADSFKTFATGALKTAGISTDHAFNGFGIQDSSLPPREKYDLVPDMRANPKYIRYLYAAGDKYTALLEARSNINSLVSVASIEVLEPLRILDITSYPESNQSQLFELIWELNFVFSIPVKGELKDYLLPQVISEYIKLFDCNPQFDGICYKSSQNPCGKNYTLFDESKYKPISSEAYFIDEICLTAYSITEEHPVKIDKDNPNS